MEEPYYLKPKEIAELTDSQIVFLYGKPRDEKTGVPKMQGPIDTGRSFVTPEEKRAGSEALLAGIFGSGWKEKLAKAKVRKA